MAADRELPQDAASVEEVLRGATIAPLGLLREASNVTLLVDLLEDDGSPTGRRAVYKPVRGERPLADFPPGTLAAREVAAYLVSETGGWGLVPPTVLREGPLGPGSVQLWVETDGATAPAGGLVDVVPADEVRDGWLPVVHAEDEEGRPLVVVHADDDRLRSLAVLDVVIDNADRKAAHVGVAGHRLWGFDHGLCLNAAPKLRTVLWGWAGEELGAESVARVRRVAEKVDAAGGELARLLPAPDLAALRVRLAGLLAEPRLPLPPAGRYPLPWPLW